MVSRYFAFTFPSQDWSSFYGTSQTVIQVCFLRTNTGKCFLTKLFIGKVKERSGRTEITSAFFTFPLFEISFLSQIRAV